MNLTDSPFFSESPVAIYTCNQAGLITAYNRAATELWGREPVIGIDAWCGAWRAYHLDGKVLGKDQHPLFIAMTRKHAPHQSELVVERPDGSRKRVLVYPMRIDHGDGIAGGAAYLVDVTYQDEQDGRQAFLSSIVESSDDAIISKDLNGIITSWNKGAQQIFGFTEEEVIGKPITILIPKERMDEETHILGRIRTGQRVDHFQTVRLSKWGDEINISLSVSPVRDNTGQIIGASKIARDITTQVKAEKAIRLYASNLEAINSIGKSIARKLDVRKVMQYVTDAATELTEATFGAFFYDTYNEGGEPITLHAFAGTLKPLQDNETGPSHWDATPNRRTPVNLKDFAGSEAAYTALDIRLPDVQRQGAASYLQVPIVSADDEVVGELFFGHLLPGQFNSRHEELIASIAAQAAIALDNSKLFEEVKTLSRRKDEFIALASHELKTPLTSIGGFLQIVAKKTNDPIPLKFIDKAINQVAKLNKLVADLLDAARLENNKLPLHTEDFDCRDLLASIVEDFRYAHPAHPIHFDNTGTDIFVKGDKQRLEQVFINLLDNAIKYSPGTHAVHVDIASQNDKVSITIKDNGIGMDEHQQKGLFTRFYRAQNGAAKVPGLGLGLYLSKKIVDEHNGELTCRSAPAEGSAFTVTLPRVS